MLKQEPYQTPVSNHASLDRVQHVQAQVIVHTRSLSTCVHQATAVLHVSCATETVKIPDPTVVQEAARKTLQEAAGLDWRRESCRPMVPIL